MSIRNLILLIVIISALIVFALENASPVVPLVILGSETVALPLWVWLLGAIAAGALTTLIIAGLIQVAGSSPRPPKSGYYSDRPRYRPPTDDAAFDDDEDWQVVDVEGDRPSTAQPFSSRPSDAQSGASPMESSTKPTANTGFFNREKTGQDASQDEKRTSFFSSFSSKPPSPASLEDWDQFSLRRSDWDDWNQYEEAAPAGQRGHQQSTQRRGAGSGDRSPSTFPEERRTAFTAPETVIQDSQDRDWQDWSGYQEDWRDGRDDDRGAAIDDEDEDRGGYGDRRPYDEAVYSDDARDDDARNDYARDDEDAQYYDESRESAWVGGRGNRDGDRYDEKFYPEDSYQDSYQEVPYPEDSYPEVTYREQPYREESYREQPYQDAEYEVVYETVVDAPMDDEDNYPGEAPYEGAAAGYDYSESDGVEDNEVADADSFGQNSYRSGEDLEDSSGYYTDYVRYSDEDDYYDDYDEYATAERNKKPLRTPESEKHSGENNDVVVDLDDEAAWDSWEEDADNASPSNPPSNTQDTSDSEPERSIYEVQRQPIAVNRTGTIYSYSYRDANVSSDESPSETSTSEPGQSNDHEQLDSSGGVADSDNSSEQTNQAQPRILTTPPPQEFIDDSHSP
jgi:hypothetical protein